MPVFVEIESGKVSFVFQRRDRNEWLHYHGILGMPPHWPASILNSVAIPKVDHIAFDSVSAYLQNTKLPPTEQILCWVRQHLHKIAASEKFDVGDIGQGFLDYQGRHICGCSKCPNGVKVYPLQRFMCKEPSIKPTMRWGFADGRSTLIGIWEPEGFPPWCPLPRVPPPGASA